MKTFKVCFAFFFVLVNLMTCSCSDPAEKKSRYIEGSTQTSIAQTLSNDDYLKLFKYYLIKYNLHPEELKDELEYLVKTKSEYYEWYQNIKLFNADEYGAEVKGEGISMTFGPKGELGFLHNFFLGDAMKIYLKKHNLHEADLKPMCDKSEILDMATKYLNDLAGEIIKQFSFSLRDPVISFDSGPPHFGVWKVYWERQINGYAFPHEVIEVYIHEKYGLSHFALAMSEMDCPTIVKISKEQAEKSALVTIQKIIDSAACKFETFMPDLKAKVRNTKLIIVYPDYTFTPAKRSANWPAIDPNASPRLAYRVDMQWISSNGLYVDIDAATSEVLGGDYVMDAPNPTIFTIPSNR